MRFVRPELDMETVTLAEDQEEYRPITVGIGRNPGYGSRHPDGRNCAIIALRLAEEERQALLAGADLYVQLLTFGDPMQPILVTVGKHDMAQVLGINPL